MEVLPAEQPRVSYPATAAASSIALPIAVGPFPARFLFGEVLQTCDARRAGRPRRVAVTLTNRSFVFLDAPAMFV